MKSPAPNFNAKPGGSIDLENASSVQKSREQILEKMLSLAPENCLDLAKRLLLAFEHPEVRLEEYPQLQNIQQQIDNCMQISPTETPSLPPCLSREELIELSKQLDTLPRPILQRGNQAFIRVLNKQVAVQDELTKIQTLGPKNVSPMTLVGDKAPFEVYDQSAWRNRSGLLFRTETLHVAGYKHNFGSDRLADFFKTSKRKQAYRKLFAQNSAGDPAQLHQLVNQAFKVSLSELPKLQAKYSEMDMRRQGKIADQSSKHELVDFLKIHCGFDEANVRPFSAYQVAFEAALTEEPDREKLDRLSLAARKLKGRDNKAQKVYLERGAVTPENQKYKGLNAFRHNEHLCLPQTDDIEGAYVNLSSAGMAHALSLQDALASNQFAQDQQRLYTYHPGASISLATREEIESLQSLVQAIETGRNREETHALLATHQSRFPDSNIRLHHALVKVAAKEEASALFLSCFNPNDLSEDHANILSSLLTEASVSRSYPIVLALFNALPPEEQANALKNPNTLVGLIAAFAKNQDGLNHLKTLIDEKKIDLYQQNSSLGKGLVHVAATYHHLDAFPVLKKWGVNLNKADNTGQTPAYIAAYKGNVEVIKALAECGVSFYLAEKTGWTPVHVAAHKGHTEVLIALAECGVDLNQADKTGWTPAHFAAKNGHAEVIKVLAEQGVDLSKVSFSKHPNAIDAFYRHAGVFDSKHYAQKTVEKKLILWIRAVNQGADPQAGIDTVSGLRDLVSDPTHKQRLYDRLLASDSFSYQKQSTKFLAAERVTLTPAVRIDLLRALGNTGVNSSLHQERKKVDNWCAAPGKQAEAQSIVWNYVNTRSDDITENPARNALMLRSFAIDMQLIDRWLGQIENASGSRFGQEKFDLKYRLLKAYHLATQGNPAQANALEETFKVLPPFRGKNSLWEMVTLTH